MTNITDALQAYIFVHRHSVIFLPYTVTGFQISLQFDIEGFNNEDPNELADYLEFYLKKFEDKDEDELWFDP